MRSSLFLALTIAVAAEIASAGGLNDLPETASQPGHGITEDSWQSTAMAAPLTIGWEDCGDANTYVKMTGLTPDSMQLGTTQALSGAGVLKKDVSGATYTMETVGVGGVSLLKNCNGDASQPKKCKIGLGPVTVGNLNYQGMKFPYKAGDLSLKDVTALTLPAGLPSFALSTTTTLKVFAPNGDQMICLKIITDGKPGQQNLQEVHPF